MTKITPEHLARGAVVYIRQSTAHQVANNLESQRRQYALADRARQLRQYGWARKYHCEISGGRNSRLDEMQAALLNVKLDWLDRQNHVRRQVAQRYSAGIRNPHIATPQVYIVNSQAEFRKLQASNPGKKMTLATIDEHRRDLGFFD